MASLKTPALRHAITRPSSHLRSYQKRFAQVHDVRFLATHDNQHRIHNKYKEALEKKAKEEGHGDVESLKQAYKSKIESLRKKAIVPGATGPLEEPAPTSSYPFPPPPPPPEPVQQDATSAHPSTEEAAGSKSTEPPGVKPLSSFVDIPKLLSLPPKEIEMLWRLRHISNPRSLCATIPASIYSTIASTARKHPQFILPLPREGHGAEIHFLQWTFPSPTTATVLFTHLAEFKLRGEYAQPHTTVTHHLDLAGPKGLVLLQGTVVEDRGVSVEEGKWLLMCLQKFYGQAAEQTPRRRLMEQFSQGDGGFKVEELLEEAEKI